MAWTTPADLKAQLMRRFDSGALLRSVVDGDTSLFPLRLGLKGPSAEEIGQQFSAVRAWSDALAAQPQVRIEWREVRHRVQGAQRLPARAWIDSLDGALAWLGKRREAERLAGVVRQTRQGCPTLLPWLARRPLQAIELAQQWPQLLAVVEWMQAHPRPGIYLRQVDVAGVHSKFIEAHRSVLGEMLELTMPAAVIDPLQSGVGRFAARHGFRDKPVRIRFRVLDPQVQSLPGTTCPDLTLDADSFAALRLPLRRVFVTENETNFLAFPSVADAIVIFGGGYGWDALAQAAWLHRCAVHYWGDIDTHGFAILDQLRARFGNVSSLLMDRATLDAHSLHWGREPEQCRHDLPRLSAEERTLYDALRDNRIGDHLRLEQERVGFQWVRQALAGIGG
ncbi:MAG: DUF2220 family protein [Pseudomonadota bacterium]|nr:DUF2220 family protein [Pseudomonadota bacterium]